ncbi:MAG: hypothetical protein AAGI46_03955 [Planctomycetota bacterium]
MAATDEHTADAATPVADASVVLPTLRTQAAAYRRLQRLASEQAKALSEGDHTRLLAVLDKRKAALAEATADDDAVAATRSNWPASVAGWSADDHAQAERLFGEIKSILAELSKQDDRAAAGLRVRIATAGNELSRIRADDRTVRRLNRRYAAAAYGEPQTKVDVRS